MLRASGTVDIVEGSWITDSFAYEMGGALALGAGVMTLANGSSIINSWAHGIEPEFEWLRA